MREGEGEGAGGIRVLTGRVTFEAPACVHQPLKLSKPCPSGFLWRLHYIGTID